MSSKPDKAPLKGLPPDHPDSLESRYKPAPAATSDASPPMEEQAEPSGSSSFAGDGYGDDRMDSSASNDPGPEQVEAAKRVVAMMASPPPVKKLIRIMMETSGGTFTTPASGVKVCENAVLVSIPERDDLPVFVPAAATELKLTAPGHEPMGCYFPGAYFRSEGGNDDNVLVFIRQ